MCHRCTYITYITYISRKKLHQKVNSYWDMNSLRDNSINRAEPPDPVIEIYQCYVYIIST